MPERNKNRALPGYRQTPKILFILSLIVLLYYILTVEVLSDVYANPVAGALFEILSIPVLILLVALPIWIGIRLFRGKEGSRFYNMAALLCIAATLILLIKNS